MTDTALRLAAHERGLQRALKRLAGMRTACSTTQDMGKVIDAYFMGAALAAPQGTTREWIVYTETVADEGYTHGVEHYHVGVRGKGRIFEVEREADAEMIIAALNDFEQRRGPLPSGTPEPEDGGARKRWANATARRIALWMAECLTEGRPIEHAIARAQAWLEANGAPAASEGRKEPSAALLNELREHVHRAIEGCHCTLRERDSGHLADCYAPALITAMQAADTGVPPSKEMKNYVFHDGEGYLTITMQGSGDIVAVTDGLHTFTHYGELPPVAPPPAPEPQFVQVFDRRLADPKEIERMMHDNAPAEPRPEEGV